MDTAASTTTRDAEYAELASAVVVRSQQGISCDLSDEAVILHLGSGVYFGLDGVGAAIWQIIKSPHSVEEIRDELLREYEVDAATCERAVARFVKQLASKGLVEIA